MTDRTLNATAACLLGFLHERPQSGWDLVATAQREIGAFWSLTRSQVYRELAAMAAAGLISADEKGPRDRREYRLTATGRAAFRAWLRQQPAEEHIRFPLLLTLAFAQHLEPADLQSFVAHHRELHAARMQEYEHFSREARSAGTDPMQLLPLAFGLRYEAAVLAWFEDLPAHVRPTHWGKAASS